MWNGGTIIQGNTHMDDMDELDYMEQMKSMWQKTPKKANSCVLLLEDHKKYGPSFPCT